jgi:dihydrofolate reductase
LAEGFIPTWNFLAQSPENAADAGVRKMVDTPKIVFSKSLAQHDWTNTVVNSGDLVEEIYKLKQAPGGDMIVYGGGGLVASLIRHGLIDEFHLFVNPIALGAGMPIFHHLAKRQALHLVKSIAFECGIVLLNYTLKKHHLY